MTRLRWSCTLTFKQFVAFLVNPFRSKNVRSIDLGDSYSKHYGHPVTAPTKRNCQSDPSRARHAEFFVELGRAVLCVSGRVSCTTATRTAWGRWPGTFCDNLFVLGIPDPVSCPGRERAQYSRWH